MKKRRHIKSRNQDLLRKASIHDLIYRVAMHKQKNGKLDGTIKDIDFYDNPLENLIMNMSVFLYHPYLEPENQDVCFIINDVLRRHDVYKYVKYIEPSIQKLSIDELVTISLKLSRSLCGISIDYNDLKFVKQIVGLTVFIWEMSKRFALNTNPKKYALNTSLALYYYNLWKRPNTQSDLNYIFQKYLGLDLPNEMNLQLEEIASCLQSKDTDEAFYILIEVLNKRTELKLSSLSNLECCKLGFVRDKDINYIPNATKNRLIDELRKRRRFVDSHGPKDNHPIDEISDLPKYEKLESLIDVKNWLLSLSNEQEKKIAIMSYIEGYTVREISQKLKIPKSTVQDIIKKLNHLIKLFS